MPQLRIQNNFIVDRDWERSSVLFMNEINECPELIFKCNFVLIAVHFVGNYIRILILYNKLEREIVCRIIYVIIINCNKNDKTDMCHCYNCCKK